MASVMLDDAPRTVSLDRLDHTGQAEVLTVDDERAREAELAQDVAAMRKSMQQIDDGDYLEAGEFFDGLRAKLLAMKAEQEKAAK